MKKWVTLLPILTLLGCGAGLDKKSLGIDTNVPTDPVITSIAYTFDGSTITELPPFSLTRSINPDLATHGCSASQAYVNIQGTFDNAKTKTLTLTGTASQTVTLSTSHFQIDACLSLGGIALVLKATNDKGTSNPSPALVSLNVTSTLTTIGYGNPKYPNPGFRLQNGAAPSALLGVGSPELRNVSVGDHGTQQISSTGKTGLTMDVGYVNVISQVSQ